MTVLALAVAAAAGAVLRYVVDRTVADRTGAGWPAGTLAVNLTGSLLLGFVVGLGIFHGVGDPARAVVGTGFIGAYTTFSTFAYETVRLVEDGAVRHALLNIGLSVAGGLAAAATGMALASAL